MRVWRRRSRRSAPALEREAKDAYPATLQLHLAYFHQDWGEEYGTAENAVAMFIQRSDLAPLLAGETRRILDTFESEEDLDSFFETRMGSDFIPELDGFTWRSFLQWVVERSAA